MATGKDDFRKPERGMWDFFVQNMNGGAAPDLRCSSRAWACLGGCLPSPHVQRQAGVPCS